MSRFPTGSARRLVGALLVVCSLFCWTLVKPTQVEAQDQIFTAQPIWFSFNPINSHHSTVGDIDLDGDLDIIAGSTYLLPNELTFTVFADELDFDFPDSTSCVVFGDINSDGYLDLVVATDRKNQLFSC